MRKKRGGIGELAISVMVLAFFGILTKTTATFPTIIIYFLVKISFSILPLFEFLEFLFHNKISIHKQNFIAQDIYNIIKFNLNYFQL